MNLKTTCRSQFSELTENEQKIVLSSTSYPENRTIPWTIVGLATTPRVRLVHRLLKEADPKGFVYLYGQEPISERELQFKERVLRFALTKSRYQISYGCFENADLDAERFKKSLLAGCVSLQVVPDDCPTCQPHRFSYLYFSEVELVQSFHLLDFESLRKRFRHEFSQHPTLARD